MQEREERRRKERYELRLAMQVWPTGTPGFRYSARTVNVNAAGVLFVLSSGNPEDFRPGMSFRFNIELAAPDGTRPLVEGTGQVVRVDQNCNRRIALTLTTWRFVRQAVEVPQSRMTQRAS
jgi:hypothetical protein